MARILFAVVSSLFLLQSLAAPLPRSTFACSVNGTTVARIIAADILLVQSLVEELDVNTLVDSTPLASVQSSLADAKAPADLIENILLFPDVTQPPSDATSVILSSLQDAMTTFATVEATNATETAKVAETTKFLNKAFSDAQIVNAECASA
ncbi:hypothetical protein C8R46DRAFT_1352098 [Mycena filopes]|nr:hypothetical protein C8R46DRAFT_1352098 [Mycena filopes]